MPYESKKEYSLKEIFDQMAKDADFFYDCTGFNFVIFNDLRKKIKKVIFNSPATIILWADDTKTVVKASGEAFDKEKGVAMAIVKKLTGNLGRYNEIIKYAVALGNLNEAGVAPVENTGESFF